MNIKNVINNPLLLLKSKNIFLLSHMRGNTSLLSHLLGNHPEIEGYYEMHIGYYSWKSVYRQKLIYTQEHRLKANSRYFFDKILHNDHYLDENILKKSKVIIMLRKPDQTIKSIMTLYQKMDPNHPYCQEKIATQYYIERITAIQEQAKKIPQQFLYLNAEDIRNKTTDELLKLQKYIGLKSTISDNYSPMKNTGKEKYGDSSKNIRTGKVQQQTTNYSDITLNPKLLEQAQSVYKLSKNYLISSNYKDL